MRGGEGEYIVNVTKVQKKPYDGPRGKQLSNKEYIITGTNLRDDGSFKSYKLTSVDGTHSTDEYEQDLNRNYTIVL
jgi:hypothetical protein